MDILAQQGRIFIQQRKEVIEMISSFEANNRYAVCDSTGRPILMAMEDSSCLSRLCCRSNRPFNISMIDLRGITQIRLIRNYTYNWFQCCSCSSCCQDCVVVESPPGRIIGSVAQCSSCCKISFNVFDMNQQPLLFLKGPRYCLCTWPGTVHTFKIMSTNGNVQLGKLQKNWSGVIQEMFTNADNFELIVPQGMPVESKVLLIAAGILIDFMFFEDRSSKFQ